MPNIHFSARESDKKLAKHISTNVPFESTLWNRHIYIDIRLR